MIPNRAPLPRIYLVTSGREHAGETERCLRQAEALGQAGPVMFQLREKGLDAARLFELARRLNLLLSDTGTRLLVNERADIAAAAGADGVHLPESSCPPDTIRKVFPALLAGQSVHSVRAAIEAEKSGIHYLMFGPVFSTPSKERFGPPQGLDNLEKVCRSVSVPVYAVGGITPERSFACLERGAWGVAAISPFIEAGKLRSTIETFYSHMPI